MTLAYFAFLKNLLDELKSARFLWRDNQYSTKTFILTLISAKHFRAISYSSYSAYPTYGNASLYILNLTMNKTTNLKYLSRLGATGFAAATFCLFIATVSSGKLHFIFNILKYSNKVLSGVSNSYFYPLLISYLFSLSTWRHKSMLAYVIIVSYTW